MSGVVYTYIFIMPAIRVTNMKINNVNDKQENNLKNRSISEEKKKKRIFSLE